MHANRRTALKSLAASSLALALPTVVPSVVLGRDAKRTPGNRITLGLIGCGSRMDGVAAALAGVPGTQVTAVCDVWEANRESFGTRYGVPANRRFNDFRDLVALDDIDAVAIASPDHWHVPQSIAAIEAGKDVYCEKPLSNTIREGRALVAAAARYGAVFQHGTQLHSFGAVRQACELVRNGRLGKLEAIYIGSPPGLATRLHPEMPVPRGLDYDLWLGPAPLAPFTQARVFREGGLPGWYFISDYSKSGWIAGYGVHDLDIAQWAIGMERSGPVRIRGRGDYPREGLFDTVLTYELEFEYANGVKIVMTDTGKNRHGVKFVGEKGWIFTRSAIEASPQSLLKETIGPGEVHLYRSPDHARNFIDCTRSRAETITPPEIAHRATSTALLGGIACKLGRELKWDPAHERFVNDPEADRLLSCAMRGPWVV